MTVGVYGFVAGIVKLDDMGAWLLTKSGALAKATGRLLLLAAPKLMRLLTIVGTAAMFLVGGGILSHGIPFLHHLLEEFVASAGSLGWLPGLLADMLVGLVGGVLALAVVTGFLKAKAIWS